MNLMELRMIVAEILEIEPELLDSTTELATVDTYDSMHKLMLMLDLDEQVGIKLTPETIRTIRYYGDIEQIAQQQGIKLAA